MIVLLNACPGIGCRRAARVCRNLTLALYKSLVLFVDAVIVSLQYVLHGL